MSNNNQSSVEWLIDQLEDNAWENVSMNQLHITINMDDYREIKDKAKAMHRTEIIESYSSGSNDRLRNTINTNYYNETFNTKDK